MPGRRPSAAVREKRTRLLELCRAGVDPETIAERLGYKNAHVVTTIYWEEIGKAKARTVEDCRAQQLDRLEALWTGVYPDARKGREKAVTSAIKIMEREAKLRGLDHADQLDERRVELAEDAVDLAAVAVGAVLDAIGLTPEQELRRSDVVNEQLALVTGMAFVSLRSLLDSQEAKNEAARREAAITVEGTEG